MKAAFVIGAVTAIFAASGCMAFRPETARSIEVVSVCDVEAKRATLLEEEVLVKGYIERSQHGMYASASQCPKEYIWVVLRDKSDRDAVQSLLRNTNDEFSEPAGESIFRARVAMNDYRLPLTDHVSPRLSLEFISFVQGEK